MSDVWLYFCVGLFFGTVFGGLVCFFSMLFIAGRSMSLDPHVDRT